MSAEVNGEVREEKKIKSRLGVFASCCCNDSSAGSDEDGGKDHEVIIPKPGGCTDCAYLIVFVTFCCVLLLIGVFAFVYGNPLRLINGMDSFGNVCGTNNEKFGNFSFSGSDMTDKPYVFFFDLKNMDHSIRICVSQCPDTVIRNMEDLVEYYHNTSVNLCRYNFNFSGWDNPLQRQLDARFTLDAKSFCPDFPIPASLPILKRCIPTSSEKQRGININFPNVYKYLKSLNIFKQVLGDLAVTWSTVLLLTLLSFVISFVIVMFLHWLTAWISYVIMIVTALVCIGFTGFMWWTYASLKVTLDNTDENITLNEMIRNESAFLAYSILSTILTIVIVVIILYLRNRVGIVVELFREAGSALASMPCLIVQPILTYAALTGFFCAWLYIVLCLATADLPYPRHMHLYSQDDEFLIANITDLATEEPEITDSSTESGIEERSGIVAERLIEPRNHSVSLSDLSTLTLIEYSDGTWVKYLWWIYILGLVWCSEFILACQQMVIASSVAAWYFTRKRKEMKCVIMEAISRLVKYHLGSVALGSLLITLVKVPRLVLQFVHRVLRKWDEHRWAQWASSCCTCCLACFENCMRYVHHNAYTVIAIQGVGFCPASKLAFSALVQNALQISVINSVGDSVLFLAKCIAALLTGLIALVYFQQDEKLYFYAIPVLLTVVFAYFVAHCVISVFEMAVDTLFLCFCEDHNMHCDSPDGRFYAPERLLHFMTTDAVDYVASRRRSHKNDVGGMAGKAQISTADRQSYPEESIPMNPYGPTTERIQE